MNRTDSSCAGDGGSVQGITGPQVTGGRCLEAAEGHRRRSVGASVESEPGEVALDRALGGACALGSTDDLGHWAAVRRGTSRLRDSARSSNRFSVTGSPARDAGAPRPRTRRSDRPEIQRSMVPRPTLIRRSFGPTCSRLANAAHQLAGAGGSPQRLISRLAG